MNKYDFRFYVEVRGGKAPRVIDADRLHERDGWFIFYRKPPQGEIEEYWRVQMSDVVSVETKRP